jgi:hypothetical protein
LLIRIEQDPRHDKYNATGITQIDCENRVHLCHAACCKLTFPLSRQDLIEGIVRWNAEQPYMIAQDADGYCTHVERDSCRCGVWANRPLTCRTYDCREDPKIWINFEERLIQPDILRPGWPGIVDHASG